MQPRRCISVIRPCIPAAAFAQHVIRMALSWMHQGPQACFIASIPLRQRLAAVTMRSTFQRLLLGATIALATQSVPYELIGREVKLIYTTAEVEIYYQYQRVALHERMDSKHHYTTTAAHLPPQHQWLTQWSPTYFENWASKIGPHTRLAIVDILRHRTYPEQAYKSCAGVLSLEKKVGKDRLEAACRSAIAYKATSLRLIKSILERELDKVPVEDEKPADTSFIVH